MKRFLLAVLFVCCAYLVYAQKSTQDVVNSKNGSVVNSSEKITYTANGKKILDFPKHSFGVRAGVLFSKVPEDDLFGYTVVKDHMAVCSQILTPAGSNPEYLLLHGAGFHVGGVYEISLTKTNRWFFQTGIDLQYINTIKKKTVTIESAWDKRDVYWDYYNLTANSLFIDIPTMFSVKFPLGKGMGIYPSLGLTHTICLFSNFTAEREKVVYDCDRDWNGTVSHDRMSNGVESYKEGFDSDLNPYPRYRLNFRGELNFIVKEDFVVGVNASISFINAGHFIVGLSAGYNF